MDLHLSYLTRSPARQLESRSEESKNGGAATTTAISTTILNETSELILQSAK